MTVFGNLIWLIFGGLLTGLGYIIGGLAMCLTIVGIPFGIQSINLGMATFAPFGKEVVAEPHHVRSHVHGRAAPHHRRSLTGRHDIVGSAHP